MARLLVSVRSLAEAKAALEGNAALIDVKDPVRGPLGRAADAEIVAILQAVGGRKPVSAALGELLEHQEPMTVRGLAYAKWGLAGCAERPEWPRLFLAAARTLPPGCQAVVAAYADWQAAAAPSPDVVSAWVSAQGLPLLLDTWSKSGKTLLDYLTPETIGRLCERCRQAGVLVALAGSLNVPQIEQLRFAAPDWFAVRGAACRGGERQHVIDSQRVRRLVRAASAES